MGASQTNKVKEHEELKKFLRPGIKIEDVKNLSKAFKLLDKNNDGYIQYDIGKMTDINMKEDEMKKSCEYTKLSYNEFMDIMLNNIAKNRKTKNGIIFESETSYVTCFVCPFNKKEDDSDL